MRCQFVSGNEYNMTGLSNNISTDFTSGSTWKEVDFALYIRPTHNEIEIYEGSNSNSSFKYEFSETL